MGGEKMNKRYEEGRKPGSPPRGRGKEVGPLFLTDVPWITPAWAGKSWNAVDSSLPGGDHPRVDGEKAGTSYAQQVEKGSPPHGRGKAELSAAIDHVLGITPAWAGKSQIVDTMICNL